MEKQSLEEAINIIIDALEESNINEMDKIELMMSLNKLLANYDKSIKVLQRGWKKNENKKEI